jgi:hypothetical protein
MDDDADNIEPLDNVGDVMEFVTSHQLPDPVVLSYPPSVDTRTRTVMVTSFACDIAELERFLNAHRSKIHYALATTDFTEAGNFHVHLYLELRAPMVLAELRRWIGEVMHSCDIRMLGRTRYHDRSSQGGNAGRVRMRFYLFRKRELDDGHERRYFEIGEWFPIDARRRVRS